MKDISPDSPNRKEMRADIIGLSGIRNMSCTANSPLHVPMTKGATIKIDIILSIVAIHKFDEGFLLEICRFAVILLYKLFMKFHLNKHPRVINISQ